MTPNPRIASSLDGVTKYRLEFTSAAPRRFPHYAELNAWRGVLRRLGGIGREPTRYGGVGYGNVSVRLPAMEPTVPAFAVTATQTGDLPEIDESHYAWVHYANPVKNHLRACGVLPPSSEALTHAAAYAADTAIGAVFHVHVPVLWQQWQGLRIGNTAAAIAYGTPQMAVAVAAYVGSASGRRVPILAMLGHEDGIISWGATPEDAGLVLLRYWTRARATSYGG